MWGLCQTHSVCVALSASETTPPSVATLTLINFAIKLKPWNFFLKRKQKSEASRCSFASNSSLSFMLVASNNRKPLWS